MCILKLTTENLASKMEKSLSVPSRAPVVPKMVPTFAADQVEERDFLFVPVLQITLLLVFLPHRVTRPVDLLVNVLGIAGGCPVQFMALKGAEIGHI